MPWTENFRGVDYKKRAEYLLNYLRQLPDELGQKKSKKLLTPFAHGYKDVLSFIVGSLCVRSEYRYISKCAQEQFENTKKRLKKEKTFKKNIDDKPVYNHVYSKGRYPVYKGLTHEHTIPTRVIVEHLATLDKKKLEVGYLADFIEKVSGIALITTDENKKLNKIMKDKLPSDTTLDDILQGKKPHSARYEEAGIIIAETNHQAKA